jgi:hypothetical protein
MQIPWSLALHNSMEYIPSWEANNYFVGEESVCLLWNLKVHYHVHWILSWADESTPYHHILFFKINFSIILPSMPRSHNWSLPFRFLTETLYAILIHIIHNTCLKNLTLLDLMALINTHEDYKLWSSSLCSFLNPPVTSSLLGPNTLLNPYAPTFQPVVFSYDVKWRFMPTQSNR